MAMAIVLEADGDNNDDDPPFICQEISKTIQAGRRLGETWAKMLMARCLAHTRDHLGFGRFEFGTFWQGQHRHRVPQAAAVGKYL